MKINQAEISSYEECGYVVVPNAIEDAVIDDLLANFLDLVEDLGGRRFGDAHSPDIADFLSKHRDIQSRVYNEMRGPPWLIEFSLVRGITEPLKGLLGPEVALQRKIPFRIDVPFESDELAVWHQDFFYVRGNENIVTAWVPMQDTGYLNGCLAIMPKSHKSGPLDHDVRVLGKRHIPSGVFDREVRYVELKKGDVLLFHSCLLHCSNMNLSNAIRYSVQPRFTPTSQPTDPSMGGTVPVDA